MPNKVSATILSSSVWQTCSGISDCLHHVGKDGSFVFRLILFAYPSIQDCELSVGWVQRPAAAELVQARYFDREPVMDIAARLSTTEDSISSWLYRIRKQLKRCIEGGLTA